MCNEFDVHKDFVEEWFEELRVRPGEYREPILTEDVMDKVKLFCDSLQQDSHVFLTTIDILEKYVAIKNEENVKINDPLLLIITVIYMAGKSTGELSEFKTNNLVNLYEKLATGSIDNKLIKFVEINVLLTLDNRLPLHTKIDDLKMFLHYYIEPKKLNFDLCTLCEDLLNFYVMHSMTIFRALKFTYMQNITAFNAFICIYKNRLYLPIGILVCAFNLITDLTKVLNPKDTIDELSRISNIHSDHLYFLANQICKVWKNKKRN